VAHLTDDLAEVDPEPGPRGPLLSVTTTLPN
jgi:hypothetical protein